MSPSSSLAVCLLLALPAPAAEDGPRKVPLTSLSHATIRVSFSGTIRTTGTTKTLTYSQPLPADGEGQVVASIEVAPSPGLGHEIVEEGEGRRVDLTWTDPPEGEVLYSIVATVERSAFDATMDDPTRGTAPGFLEGGDLTKPDAAIKKQAKILAKGSSNDLETVARIAGWIHESIEYDRSYSQDKEDKQVGAVMKSGRGTCDELSHLFISMARVAGIPAREVSGLAFTGESWGFHSWSEVRLGSRWVPVDATSLEIGLVDATHIAFARDDDDASFSQSIRSLQTGSFSIEDHDLEVRIMKASTGAGVVKAEMTFDPASVPPGQPFTARLSLENPSGSWVAGPARLVVAEGFGLDADPIVTFVLPPKASKLIEWSVTTPAGLATGATYWYKMGAVLFPHLVAAAQLTIASGLIGEVAALEDEGGAALVTVELHNPLPDAHTSHARVCLHQGWDLGPEPLCLDRDVEIPAKGSVKLDLPTEFVIAGDFTITVQAKLADLTDERIHKVDVDAQP